MLINIEGLIRGLSRKKSDFTEKAHSIFSGVDSSKSRVISLYKTRDDLTGLSIKQEKLFTEALECIEFGFYRAAHVIAWAAFIDYIEERISSDGLIKVFDKYPKWAKHKKIETLRENIVEAQIVEASYKIGFLGKTEKNSIQGYLSTRNECAHPSDYAPGMNDTIGYVSNLLNRISKLQKKEF